MAYFEGSIGTPSRGFDLKVEYSYTQDKVNNKSIISSIKGYCKKNNSSYNPYNSSKVATIKLERLNDSDSWVTVTTLSDSSSYSFNGVNTSTYLTFVSGSNISIPHKLDGKQQLRITFYVDGKLSSYYPIGSISQTHTLTAIPRKATLLTSPSFTDEDNPTITYENKAGSAVETLQACISLTGSLDDIAYRDIPKTGTLSYTFELTDEERKILRQASSNTKNRNVYFYIKTVLSGVTYFSHSDYDENKLTIINATPIFENFNFKDVNEKTVALTGSNQDVILGYSQVQVTIPVENKAIAQKEAIIKTYRYNNVDKEYNEIEDVVFDASVVTSGEFRVYATDSRQNTKDVIKLAQNAVEYVPLIKNTITVKRENGVSVNTNLSFRGKIDLKDFGTIVNSIKKVVYRYSIAGKNEWSSEYSLEINVDEDGNFSFNGLIAGDIENVGFDINNAYDIEVFVEDELSNVIFTTILGSGTPHIAYAKNGVGIMGKYDESVGGLLQVGGKSIDNIGGDAVPIGSIFDYDGETVPDGYELVEDYSSNEVEIGTWFGKPMYRTVVEWNNFAIADTTTYSHNIKNVEQIIGYKGYFSNNGAVYEYPLNARSGAVLGATVNPTMIVWVGNDSWSANTNRIHRFIIEYTKTND